MSRGNGTGPLGKGPMTGRGMGYCVMKLPEGGGSPQGFAGVAGWPVGTRASIERDIAFLKGLADSLQTQLEAAYARLREIERKTGR